MKILYLGTGAAEGIPAVFCNCDTCKRARKLGGREVRSRAQVLIDKELSIDFPPDSFYHAAVLGADLSAIKYLLVTHAHMDHFYAHDFVLRGYKYAANITAPDLDIYANAEACEVYRECTRREMKQEVGAHIRLHEIRAFEKIAFGDYAVYTLAAQHSSSRPLLFLIEKGDKRILHLTDTGALIEESLAYLAGLGGKPYDLVTLDCTFLSGETLKDARHMGLDENMRTLERLKAHGLVDGHTKRVITHFSHNSSPFVERLGAIEREYGVIAAYDGMEIEL